MLLVIDVGNTNIVLGIFKEQELVDHWRVSTDRLRTTDEYGVLIRHLFYLNGVNSEDHHFLCRSAGHADPRTDVPTLFWLDALGHRPGCQDRHGYQI